MNLFLENIQKKLSILSLFFIFFRSTLFSYVILSLTFFFQFFEKSNITLSITIFPNISHFYLSKIEKKKKGRESFNHFPILFSQEPNTRKVHVL